MYIIRWIKGMKMGRWGIHGKTETHFSSFHLFCWGHKLSLSRQLNAYESRLIKHFKAFWFGVFSFKMAQMQCLVFKYPRIEWTVEIDIFIGLIRVVSRNQNFKHHMLFFLDQTLQCMSRFLTPRYFHLRNGLFFISSISIWKLNLQTQQLHFYK